MQDLAAEGYAGVVFTPEELGGVNPNKLEEALINYGWEVIAAAQMVKDKEDKKHQELEHHEAYGV